MFADLGGFVENGNEGRRVKGGSKTEAGDRKIAKKEGKLWRSVLTYRLGRGFSRLQPLQERLIVAP
jgi:hypothetical protein